MSASDPEQASFSAKHNKLNGSQQHRILTDSDVDGVQTQNASPSKRLELERTATRRKCSTTADPSEAKETAAKHTPRVTTTLTEYLPANKKTKFDCTAANRKHPNVRHAPKSSDTEAVGDVAATIDSSPTADATSSANITDADSRATRRSSRARRRMGIMACRYMTLMHVV